MRHPSSRDHPLRDLWAPRIDHSASGYADAHDAQSLHQDPVCTLGGERRPVDPEHDVASAPTFSRLAHQSQHRSNRTQTGFSSTSPVPVRSTPCDSG
jgi:hypothetical protein